MIGKLGCLRPVGPVKLLPRLPECEKAIEALLRGLAREEPLLPRDCRAVQKWQYSTISESHGTCSTYDAGDAS
jgi:hypothetical protein